MKKYVRILTATLFFILGSMILNAAPKKLQVGFTTAMNPDDPYFVFGTEFARIVKEKTKGGIEVDLLGAGQLGQEREMFEGMQLGTVDMAIMTNAYASNFVAASGLFDLPFIFAGNKVAADILDGPIGQAVLAEYTKEGVIALAWGEGGFRHLVTMKTPVRKPADFAGLKIRCMETKTYIATYNAVGANAVPMAWSETITGLQQGTIDGLDIPISVIYSNGFPDIAKYLNLTGHFYSPLVMCISAEIWGGFSKEEQAILKDAAVEAGKADRAHNARVEGELLKKMKDAGMNIIDDVDIPAFQAQLKNFYGEQKGAIGGTYVDDLLKVLAETK
ncbi:MAG: TRAP transporter substrate-binding protein DctP [Fusobacteriaceae bacterium]|jgi:tripartite ATP-independent transporter DctP family solute receptor|nr:TRAP transporter substrate-binding protein DctP [Fusobacteriaceae bacterium]